MDTELKFNSTRYYVRLYGMSEAYKNLLRKDIAMLEVKGVHKKLNKLVRASPTFTIPKRTT